MFRTWKKARLGHIIAGLGRSAKLLLCAFQNWREVVLPPRAQPTTKIAQHASRSNKPRHSRRACSCDRRSGFISCRLGIERPYAESHPAARLAFGASAALTASRR
jgi:hypothetical protein